MENHPLHDPSIENVFYKISKILIIVPILILALGILLNFKTKNSTAKISALYSTPTPTAPPVTPKANTNFDLKGPYSCSYTDKQATVSAYIQNKEIAINYAEGKKVDTIRLKGDCLYKSESGQIFGEKTCNLTKAISLLDNLSQLNLLNADTVVNMLPGGFFNEKKPDLIQKTLANCYKDTIPESTFDLPKNVVYKEVVATSAPAKP
jgi:hypothetical protein